MYLDFPVPSAHFLRILPAWKITLCSGHLFWGVSHIVPTEAFCLNLFFIYKMRISGFSSALRTFPQNFAGMENNTL